jgi:hypothetical protein
MSETNGSLKSHFTWTSAVMRSWCGTDGSGHAAHLPQAFLLPPRVHYNVPDGLHYAAPLQKQPRAHREENSMLLKRAATLDAGFTAK